MRCVVPNCENTVGVSFPVEYELQNIWLKSLQITDGVPDIDSFVCLDHFAENDVEEIVNEEGTLEKRIRPGAVPLLLPVQDPIEKETEEFLEFRTTRITNAAVTYSSPEPSDIFGTVQEELSDSSKKPTVEEQPLLTISSKTEGSEEEQIQFVPQFQEFQEGDLALPHQEFSETQTKSFPSYSQSDEIEKSQEQDRESNLVIQESQDFLPVQDEFATPQVFTEEDKDNNTVRLYTPEGQSVFAATGGEHVFVEGKPLFASEGQIFVSKEQQSTEHESPLEETFKQIHDIKQEKILEQNSEYAQQNEIIMAEEAEEQQHDESQREHTDINMEVMEPENQNEVTSEEQLQAEGNEEEIPQEEIPQEEMPHEENETQKKSTMFQSQMGHDYCDNMQPPPTNDNVVEDDGHQLLPKSSTPPENIVMQWFVPNQPNTESVLPSKSPSNVSDIKNRIVISYPKEAISAPSRVIHQHVVKAKHHEIPSPVRAIKRVDMDDPLLDSCRLCTSIEQVSINILDNIKDNIMVLEAIQLCIHPLEVSLEDPFSKKICVKCFNQLQRYFEFRQNCIRVDVENKRAYEKAHPQHRFLEKRKPMPQMGSYPKKAHMKTIISPSKLGYRQTEVVTVLDSGSKNVLRKVILTPTLKKRQQSEGMQYLMKEAGSSNIGPNEKYVRQIISKVSKADDIQVFKLKKSPHQNGQSYAHPSQKSSSLPITISPGSKLNPNDIEALARKPPLSVAKQMKIQEEMKKVIEGKMSKDDICVDQVIVRVVSDDENEEKADHFPAKRKKYNMGVMNVLKSKQEFSKMRIGRSEVILPKGIRVSVPDKFESSKGLFPCFPKIGVFGSVFALIDGYLFEYRLCKGKERNLKCITPNCSAHAVQKLLSTEKFENRAWVKISHNHLQSTSTELKKQMFYHVMKKRMQADRGLNFRNIYDQICEKDPEIKTLVPLRSVVNEICKQQLTQKVPTIKNFDDFYGMIEDDTLQKFQFTLSGTQFYQERFMVEEDGTKAVIFANIDTIRSVSHSKLMYVDASFRIDTGEQFGYQLVTVLVWVDDSYYPIMFALVSSRTMEIFKKIFAYLHDTLAPHLCPEEIVTDYEANIYYALGETYLESHIGGSVFYYTQNLYKKICELGVSKELESTSYFRNIYHMLLMLPLLPVNTIMDGLQNIEIQAGDLGIGDVMTGIFDHVKEQWMEKVTPDLFCVHRLENRINENVIAPFKKLRDFLMLNKGKTQRQTLSIMNVVEKLIDLENFLQSTYSSENKKSFGRDLSSSQKKNVLKAWQYIETHPKININHFFTKVIGYIKCMENQLWIWGYYKFSGTVTDDLINAANFSIVNTNEGDVQTAEEENISEEVTKVVYSEDSDNTVVLEAVVGPSGEFVISNTENNEEMDSSLFKYVYKNNDK